ncbi:MAG: metallophosphoesterase [archaeon]
MSDLIEKVKEHPRKKLRVLASGDIHGDAQLAEKLAEKAVKENVDIVILCGDLTMMESSTENIIGPFVKRHKKVLLIPGNHETVATADFLAEVYGVKNIHGYSVRYKEIGIFGAGGANIGVHQIPEGEMYDLLKKGFDHVKYLEKKIMVTHVHPSKSMMEKFSKFVPGSDGVRKAVDKLKPDILLCSHVHEAEGLEETIGGTKVINVGSDGKVFDL